MPGPWSLAITMTPTRSLPSCTLMATSPRLAYMRMLRAISEMAAAMTVWSPSENPALAASSRPFCLTVTMSTSAATGRSDSSGTLESLLDIPFEEGQAFLQVERRRHPFQGEAQLHHREGDFGLD